ncbi:hypothetical protein [Halostreptopolyspora alba]|uniref:Uncharacterized protein n=1 Tax=Halostreptopolyspora alba TaxID=2487137 RepID=A0A3N0DYN5_9ACTN|nr:hypothetical protein EFW17_22590 [Nocardiopsaceae bacterium YIM 96095]
MDNGRVYEESIAKADELSKVAADDANNPDQDPQRATALAAAAQAKATIALAAAVKDLAQ